LWVNGRKNGSHKIEFVVMEFGEGERERERERELE